MMKTVVHDSRVRLKNLARVINVNVPECDFIVSDVKRDGTVIVRFKSTKVLSADEACELFSGHLVTSGLDFQVSAPGQVRLSLDQIMP